MNPLVPICRCQRRRTAPAARSGRCRATRPGDGSCWRPLHVWGNSGGISEAFEPMSQSVQRLTCAPDRSPFAVRSADEPSELSMVSASAPVQLRKRSPSGARMSVALHPVGFTSRGAPQGQWTYGHRLLSMGIENGTSRKAPAEGPERGPSRSGDTSRFALLPGSLGVYRPGRGLVDGS